MSGGATLETPGTPLPPAGAPDAAAKPAKKPKGLIRWGMLVVLLAGGIGFLFAGVGPTAKWAIQKYGSQALGAPVTVESASFAPLRSELTLKGLVAKDKASAKPDGSFERDLFSAKEVVARLDLGAAIRGRLVVDELRATGARGRAVRNADGSINLGQQGEGPAAGPGEPGGPPAPPPGTSPDDPAWKRKVEEIAKERDLVEDLKELLRRLKERRDKQIAERREEEERRKKLGAGDPDARAAWVRPERPRLVIRRLVADGAVIELEDRAAGGPPRELTDVKLEVKNLSTSPSLVAEPLEVNASFAAAPAIFDAIFKETIPVVFGEKTRAKVESSLSFKDWVIDWRPLLDLADIEARAREAGDKILGIDAAKFAEALTDIRELNLRDIRIFGEAWDPTVEIGDTLKNVVVEALKKRGERAVAEQLEKGLGKVGETLGEKLGPDAAKAIEETGAGAAVKKGKEVLEEGVGGALESLFGGEKKKEQK